VRLATNLFNDWATSSTSGNSGISILDFGFWILD